MIWLQRIWSRRTASSFSHALVVLALVATLALAVAAANLGLIACAAVLLIGVIATVIAGNQHRLRHLIGADARGDNLLEWLGQHGGEFSMERQPVSEAPFDIGRALWRMRVDSDADVSDAVRRRTDGAFAFVAHHRAVEQFLVIPTPVLPTVMIDETTDPDLVGQRAGGHTVQTDEPAFARVAANADTLIHIENEQLGSVTFVDGFLISRSPYFVDGPALEQRLTALRQVLRAVPPQMIRRHSREEELVTRLRPAA